MDKYSKLVLEKILKDSKQFTDSTLAFLLNLDLKIIDEAINNLLELELIRVYHQDSTYTSYILTNKGKMYYKTKFKESFDKYLFPIILAVITYLLGLVSGLILR